MRIARRFRDLTCTFKRNTTFGNGIPDLGIFHQVDDDDFDWDLTSTHTPTFGTGPSADHTGGSKGFYAYVEASGRDRDGEEVYFR